MTPVIRNGTEDDLVDLTHIYNHYVMTTAASFDLEPFTAEQWHRDWFSRYSTQGPHRLIVASDDRRVLGYATSSTFQSRAAYATTVATSVYCAPDVLGQGLGSRLYAHLFEAIATEDLHRAVAGITLPNEASLRLHLRFGFSEIGIEHEVGRKFDRFWDVLLLERPLP